MIVPQAALCDLYTQLKHWRKVVRRHNAFLALLNMKPEGFLDTNGRDLIRQAAASAVGECVKLETAIIELQKAAGVRPKKGRQHHA